MKEYLLPGINVVVIIVVALGLHWAGVTYRRYESRYSTWVHIVVGVLLYATGFSVYSGGFNEMARWVVNMLFGICAILGTFQFIFIWSPPWSPSSK